MYIFCSLWLYVKYMYPCSLWLYVKCMYLCSLWLYVKCMYLCSLWLYVKCIYICSLWLYVKCMYICSLWLYVKCMYICSLWLYVKNSLDKKNVSAYDKCAVKDGKAGSFYFLLTVSLVLSFVSICSENHYFFLYPEIPARLMF